MNAGLGNASFHSSSTFQGNDRNRKNATKLTSDHRHRHHDLTRAHVAYFSLMLRVISDSGDSLCVFRQLSIRKQTDGEIPHLR
jgi:hypothetical protein